MRMLLIAVVGALALTATAQAGNPSLCARDGWVQAQSASGEGFGSLQECAKAREVFSPTLTLNPAAVTAGQTFTVSGAGFHAATSAELAFAVTGQTPYFTVSGVTNADGSFLAFVRFTDCGSAPPYALTLTVTDSFGVHASAPLTLC